MRLHLRSMFSINRNDTHRMDDIVFAAVEPPRDIRRGPCSSVVDRTLEAAASVVVGTA